MESPAYSRITRPITAILVISLINGKYSPGESSEYYTDLQSQQAVYAYL